MAKIAQIRTERLVLRALCAGDAEAIATQIVDWDVIRMLARPPFPYTRDHAHDYLAKAVDFPWEYAITRHGALIGVTGVTGHLGYWLAKPHWGHGYMTEACTGLIDTYFARTRSAKIVSGAFADNPGSQAVLGKLGFVQTGTSRQFVPARGAEVDHVTMCLTRPDWEARA